MKTQSKIVSIYKPKGEKSKVKDLAEVLYLYADILFYPEKDFFILLNELGYSKLINKIKSLENIQNQYVSLFEINLKGVECVPFASYWYNKRLLGKEAIKLKRFYEKCGFKFNEMAFKMPWDYISIELSFLANLIENKKYKEAKEMIKNHMGWIERFKECLKTKNRIYYTIVKDVCTLLNSFDKEG